MTRTGPVGPPVPRPNRVVLSGFVASERLYGDPSAWERAVAHVDMDAFYVSVELLTRPELRGKPVIVGPIDPSSRGVVMTASYEARKFGVHSALPIAVARRRCPQAVMIPRDPPKYKAASEKVMAVFGEYSSLVEVVGLDEAYIDLSDSPAPKARARQIKQEVFKRTGLTCSIGLGPNRLIAKIASDLDKPDGLCVLPQERFLEVIGDRPARIIPGVGPRTEERLLAAGLRTVSELAAAEITSLSSILGPNHAEGLKRRAAGYGSSEVAIERERKSESRERTFLIDEADPGIMRAEIDSMARTVATHLGEQGIRGRTVTLKIRLAPFRTFTRSRTLPEATSEPGVVAAAAGALFEAFERDAPVRLLGVGVSNLTREGEATASPAPSRDKATGTGPEQLLLA
jgi:DNA polymerase-4